MYKSKASVLTSEKKCKRCSNVSRRNEESKGKETVVVHLQERINSFSLMAKQIKIFLPSPKRLARTNPRIRNCSHAVMIQIFATLALFLPTRNPFLEQPDHHLAAICASRLLAFKFLK